MGFDGGDTLKVGLLVWSLGCEVSNWPGQTGVKCLLSGLGGSGASFSGVGVISAGLADFLCVGKGSAKGLSCVSQAWGMHPDSNTLCFKTEEQPHIVQMLLR